MTEFLILHSVKQIKTVNGIGKLDLKKRRSSGNGLCWGYCRNHYQVSETTILVYKKIDLP